MLCLKGSWRRIIEVSGCYQIWHSKKCALNLDQYFFKRKNLRIYEGAREQIKRLKEGAFAHLDDLIFKLVLTVRSRSVASTSILKTKVKELAEKISIKGFQTSDGWLNRWRNSWNDFLRRHRETVSRDGIGRRYREKATLARLKWPHHGRKQLSPQFCLITNLGKFIM